ncbi:MAG TPA: hypothetical protein VGO22_23230 [Pseudorhizobium sp.]|jgi:hypothetical protein|nr:hypothetical protein [Pseudorhizobium sp.]
MKNAILVATTALLLGIAAPAHAQDQVDQSAQTAATSQPSQPETGVDERDASERITARLNDAGLCDPLKMDLAKVAAILGYEVPAISLGALGEVSLEDSPVDTVARWDKPRHKATFSLNDADRTFKLDIALKCQPSEASAVIEIFDLDPGKWALEDNATCSGRLAATAVRDMECEISGFLGKGIGRAIDFEQKVRNALAREL